MCQIPMSLREAKATLGQNTFAYTKLHYTTLRAPLLQLTLRTRPVLLKAKNIRRQLVNLQPLHPILLYQTPNPIVPKRRIQLLLPSNALHDPSKTLVPPNVLTRLTTSDVEVRRYDARASIRNEAHRPIVNCFVSPRKGFPPCLRTMKSEGIIQMRGFVLGKIDAIALAFPLNERRRWQRSWEFKIVSTLERIGRNGIVRNRGYP